MPLTGESLAPVAVADAYIAVGANLGDAKSVVTHALQNLAKLPQTRLVRASSLYRTAPFQASGPDFINAVGWIQTELPPLSLLHALQEMENQAGRERPYRNAPRTLDLDIILFGNLEIVSPELTIPHPRYTQRAFVLHPLAEIAPQRVPVQWLQQVNDQVISRL